MTQLSPSTEVLISDFADANPPDFDIPAMICQPEKNFYYWLTSNHAPGLGDVVEFGVWLGASTAYLSAGLRGRAMHCYDNFRWYEDDNSKSAIHLKEGDDFFPLFAENMARCGANVIVHRSDIADFSWEGGPIELLIIDAPKQGDGLAKLLAGFAPHFIPGQTRIALQDYQYFPSYQIAVVMDSLRSSMKLEHVVVAVNNNKQPNTVAFRVVGPVDVAQMTEVLATCGTWSAARIHETWSRIMGPLPDQARARMAPGLALFLYDAGHEDEALCVLAETPMDKTMLKRWGRLADLKHPMAGLRPLETYPRLFTLMRETRLDPARAIPNARRQQSLVRAVALDPDADPRLHIAAWTEVLAQNSPRSNAAKRAAKRLVSAATQLGDPSEMVRGLIALLDATPEDRDIADHLAKAAGGVAISAEQAQEARDCLGRNQRVGLELGAFARNGHKR